MSLFKRGGVWWIYTYQDGVRHQCSAKTSDRKQAKKIEAKLREEAINQRFQIVDFDPNLKFDELVARFVAGGSVRPHHLDRLKFLLPFFSGLPVMRITKSLTDEYRRERMASTSIKDATVNRDLSVLRRIFYWGVDEQLLAANPLVRLKMVRERRTRRQILSIAEEESLLGVAPRHLYTMIIAAIDTGMRRGEITSQRWEDVDFSRAVLSVTRSKTPEGESREIPLTRRLCELLFEKRKSAGTVIEFKGQPVRIVKRAWATALKNAKVRHLRFHDLRHTFATRLMEAGVLQEIRMALMGHSTGGKVHATYTHIEFPAKREAIRKLEQWVSEQQLQLNKEKSNGTETQRSESDSGEAGAQTLEEKISS